MKKLAIVVAAVATLVLSGCSTVERLWTEKVPDTAEVITTPLADVVIVDETLEVTPTAE